MGLLMFAIGLCVAVVILSIGAVLNAHAQRRVIERSAEKVAEKVAEKAAERVCDALVRALDEE